MQAQTICRAPGTTHLLALMGVLVLAGGATWAEARGITPASIEKRLVSDQPDAAPTVPSPLTLTPAKQRALVWHGMDVDGDGQEDFVNPTGKAVRLHDAFGDGEFGASRDGGAREHEGVDYISRAGQAVKSPISGFVTRIGFAYADDQRLQYVEISNPAIRYVTRVFYVTPEVREGQVVRIGQEIGQARSLQARYPGITNHVHMEIARLGGTRIDAARLITARYELRDAPPAVTASAAPKAMAMATAGTGLRTAAR
jgi:hypothetical protein